MNIPAESRKFWILLAICGMVALMGLGAAHYMEEHGHIVTGMNNQVVWGIPHVFAIFMIVAASGVLNIASIGSVFGQVAYKPRAKLSGLLCLALLAGGLMVLMLDLGRPDRVIIALTHYNFKSLFAWNMVLYSGMSGLVAVYLWTMFERRFNAWSKPAGIAVLIWRFILTTGTGSIFGFLVARQAYQSAVLAPLFIVMSFAWGLSIFLIVQNMMYASRQQQMPTEIQRRMARLLGIFVAAALYLVVVYHMTNLYFARQGTFEAFILRDGGIYTLLFWLVYVLIGSVVPMVLLFHPKFHGERGTLMAAVLVVLGAIAWLFVFIIGGQVFPLDIFPGYAASSTFADGSIAQYTPSLPEFLLGLGGLGAAAALTTVGVKLFDFMPKDALAQAKA